MRADPAPGRRAGEAAGQLEARALWFAASRAAELRPEPRDRDARLPRGGATEPGAGPAHARGKLRLPDKVRLRRRRSRSRQWTSSRATRPRRPRLRSPPAPRLLYRVG